MIIKQTKSVNKNLLSNSHKYKEKYQKAKVK